MIVHLKTINLSILDFKPLSGEARNTTENPINLSILDFKHGYQIVSIHLNDYKSIHIGF